MSVLRKLAGSTAIYAVGSFGARAIALLLLPVYTRFLTPADYGVVAIAGAATSLLLVLITVSLHGSITYIWFKAEDPLSRKRDVGSVWLAMTVLTLVGALTVTWAGTFFPSSLAGDIPFDPYIRLAVWIAVAISLGYIPLGLLQAEERPVAYATLTLAAALATAAAILWQITIRRAGAEGYLYGMLLGGLAIAPVYFAVLRPRISLRIRPQTVRLALGYSLPLVPHGIAAWLLELSDRLVLERFVQLDEVGLYSIGYVLSTMVYMAATALNQAWLPVMFKRANAGRDEAAPLIADYASYFAVAVAWFALGLALFAEAVLIALTAPSYAGAAVVMPTVILAMVMQSLYLIPVGLLFQSKRTWPISVATLASGAVNVAANFAMVPQLGIRGAALATLVSYTLMLYLVWRTANRIFPVPYQYRRLAALGGTALALYLAGQCLPVGTAPWVLLTKLLLWGALPVALWFGGFLTERERLVARDLIRRLSRRTPGAPR